MPLFLSSNGTPKAKPMRNSEALAVWLISGDQSRPVGQKIADSEKVLCRDPERQFCKSENPAPKTGSGAVV